MTLETHINNTSSVTFREKEVISLMAVGLSNKAIAEQLGLKESTVKSHLSRAFVKLGARNRVEAARIAQETGLI